MEQLEIRNAFPGAAVFRLRETTSTMDEARRLVRMGFPPGTTVVADAQSSGRGRLPERRWASPPGENLLSTVILGPEAAKLPGFTLRVGLALCRTAAVFAVRRGGSLSSPPALKWPNDVLVGGRKLAGVLCEAGPEATLVGFGLNVNQLGFPPELEGKATSLALELGLPGGLDLPEILELALGELAFVLADGDWRQEAEERLWRRGEEAAFLAGSPEGGETVTGVLEGLAPSGALLLRPAGADRPLEFASGELLFRAPRVDRSGSHHIR